MKRITFWLSDELNSALRNEAEEQGISVSRYAKEAIEEYLKKLEAELAEESADDQEGHGSR